MEVMDLEHVFGKKFNFDEMIGDMQQQMRYYMFTFMMNNINIL
jgi:hypothetical protein